jgi:hypothetical protein
MFLIPSNRNVDGSSSSTSATLGPVIDGAKTFNGDVTFNGNTTFNGISTTIESTVTEVKDNTLLLNKGSFGVADIPSGLILENKDSYTSIYNDSGDIYLFTSPAVPDFKTIDPVNQTKSNIYCNQIYASGINISFGTGGKLVRTNALTGYIEASTVDDADVATLSGVQTFSGKKTFSSSPVLSSLTAGNMLSLDNSGNIVSLFSSDSVARNNITNSFSASQTFSAGVQFQTTSPTLQTTSGFHALVLPSAGTGAVSRITINTSTSANTIVMRDSTNSIQSDYISLQATTNQILLKNASGNNSIISSATTSQNTTYTLPDPSSLTASFVLDTGDQNISGKKAFGSLQILSGLSKTSLFSNASTDIDVTFQNTSGTVALLDVSQTFASQSFNNSVTVKSSANAEVLLQGNSIFNKSVKLYSVSPTSGFAIGSTDFGTMLKLNTSGGTTTLDIQGTSDGTFEAPNPNIKGAIRLRNGISFSTTIDTANTTGNRTYTLPDVSANADFVMTQGPQTLNGKKSFANGIAFITNAPSTTSASESSLLCISGNTGIGDVLRIQLNTDNKATTAVLRDNNGSANLTELLLGTSGGFKSTIKTSVITANKDYTLPNITTGNSANILISVGEQKIDALTLTNTIPNSTVITVPNLLVTDTIASGDKQVKYINPSSSNVPYSIVYRDANGDFSASTVNLNSLTFKDIISSATAPDYVLVTSGDIGVAGDKLTKVTTVGKTVASNDSIVQRTSNGDIVTKSIIFGTSPNQLTLSSATPTGNRTVTIPSISSDAFIVLTQGDQDINGATKFAPNKLIIGTATPANYTAFATNATTNRTLTTPDDSGTIALRDVSQIFTGTQTFKTTTSVEQISLEASNYAEIKLKSNNVTTKSVSIYSPGNSLFGIGSTDYGTLLRLSSDGANTFLEVRGTSTGGLETTANTKGNLSLRNSGIASTIITPASTTSSYTYTLPDVKTNADFVMNQGDQSIAGQKTFSGNVFLPSLTGNYVLTTNSSSQITTTIPTSSLAFINAANTFTDTQTVPSLTFSSAPTSTPSSGVNALVLPSGGTGAVGSFPISSADTQNTIVMRDSSSGITSKLASLTNTSNQIILGSSTSLARINVEIPAGVTKTYTLPNLADVASGTNFLLTGGTQTINGNKTFANTTIRIGDTTDYISLSKSNGAGQNTITFPFSGGIVALINQSQDFTSAQTFSSDITLSSLTASNLLSLDVNKKIITTIATSSVVRNDISNTFSGGQTQTFNSTVKITGLTSSSILSINSTNDVITPFTTASVVRNDISNIFSVGQTQTFNSTVKITGLTSSSILSINSTNDVITPFTTASVVRNDISNTFSSGQTQTFNSTVKMGVLTASSILSINSTNDVITPFTTASVARNDISNTFTESQIFQSPNATSQVIVQSTGIAEILLRSSNNNLKNINIYSSALNRFGIGSTDYGTMLRVSSDGTDTTLEVRGTTSAAGILDSATNNIKGRLSLRNSSVASSIIDTSPNTADFIYSLPTVTADSIFVMNTNSQTITGTKAFASDTLRIGTLTNYITFQTAVTTGQNVVTLPFSGGTIAYIDQSQTFSTQQTFSNTVTLSNASIIQSNILAVDSSKNVITAFATSNVARRDITNTFDAKQTINSINISAAPSTTATSGVNALVLPSAGTGDVSIFPIRSDDTNSSLVMRDSSGNISSKLASFTNTSNQLTFGSSTSLARINVEIPSGVTKTYTLPNLADVASAASFVLNAGAQTIAGVKTFSSAIKTTGLTINALITNLTTSSGYVYAPVGNIGDTSDKTLSTFTVDSNNVQYALVCRDVNKSAKLSTLTLENDLKQITVGTTGTAILNIVAPPSGTNTYNIPNLSGVVGADVILSDGGQTIAGQKEFISSVYVKLTSNQFVVGTTPSFTGPNSVLNINTPVSGVNFFNFPILAGVTGADVLLSDGAQSIAGIKTFLTPPAIKGAAGNTNAAAGYIGEYILATISVNPTSNTVATYFDITNMVLTNGDWDITLTVYVEQLNGVGSIFTVGIGDTVGNNGSGLTFGYTAMKYTSTGVGSNTTFTIITRAAISATTTYYIKYQTSQVAQFLVVGKATARRVR